MTQFRYSVVQDDEERKKLAMLSQYAFFPSPDDSKRQQLGYEALKDSFILAVYDSKSPDYPIATAASLPMTQNIRSKIFPMDGIAMVATEPVYRRQHITATMMHKIFAHDKETNIPISTLYPFKESFYARFGYITLPQARMATVNLDVLSTLLTDKTNFKSVKYTFKDHFSEYYQFLLEIQKKTHGMCLKDSKPLEIIADTRPAHLVFVYDSNDTIIGSMVYTTKGFRSDILISSFLYLNSQGKYLLLRYLALHIDQFITAKIPLSPTEHPENWLNDLRINISNRDWVPAAMARVISVEGLRDMPVGTGSVIVKIEDATCEWNNQVFKFNSNNGKLEITKFPDQSKNDCTLKIEGLTALVYGNYVLDDFEYKKWIRNVKPETIVKLEMLFPYTLPYMFDTF